MTTQGLYLEVLLDGVWTSVPVFTSGGTTITRGLDAGGSWPRPTKVACELDNDTLDYDPSNPEAAIYGAAGRNTHVRVKTAAATLTWAEASSWQPERTIEHEPGEGKGRSWTKLTAEGPLRRIGMWTDPLRSPMYRTISTRATSIGHWSLEDGRDSLVLSNSSGGRPGSFKGEVTFGESEAPLGAEQTVKVGAISTAEMSGTFDRASTTAGWQVSFSFKLDALPPSGTFNNLFFWSTSSNHLWWVDVNSTNYRLEVYEQGDDTPLFSNSVSFGAGAEPTEWVTFRVLAEQNGSDVDVEEAWYAQGMEVNYGISDSFTGSVGALAGWAQYGSPISGSTWFSHIFGVTTTADTLLGATAQKVFNGYQGELAGTRFRRLCLELGITRFTIGGSTNTDAMGPQKADTVINLLKEIVATDGGLIYDEPEDIALTHRVRRDLYDQTPALDLTHPGDLSDYVKLIDDLNTHNVVTVKNADAGEVTRALTSGPMSTQAPPDGVGEYKHTITVSVEDDGDQLDNLADWHLARGTLDRPRYESITLDLLANPGLVTDVEAVELGDMIQITGLEPDPVQLLVTGWTERIGAATRTITYEVEPYEVWQAGEYDRADSRYDARTSTVSTTETTTSTAWQVECTDPKDVWSTTSEPYDWMVAGERVTVTAMNAATGTGPYVQACTVTRSVNGVVKAQAVGNVVQLADPKRWAL